ncbi:DUF1289 domain-containing protein [Photobacterium indicum]|uniref:DUF1289 domain-containing protein n=1 Tax=Photobacterium indicum TaxID=81447 RepID=A0A2T3L9A9_9GAMM|nr:DUF1289 domain-containing protein [Photobacterium indicum]PSV47586.1 DUF1289 domain-containing protein [Photobacterium indicum]
MEQLDFFTVPSPCVGICQVNNRGYCKGCYRSRDERFNWQVMTSDQKRQVIRLCKKRYLRILRRAKGSSIEVQQVDDNPQQSLF